MTTQSVNDVTVLRDLVRRYTAICNSGEQHRRRDAWRAHNSFHGGRPLIYARAFAWHELDASRCVCEDALLREVENGVRQQIYWASLEDDAVFEPWLTINAAHVMPREGEWGLPIRWIQGADPRGAKALDPPIKQPEDAERMTVPKHEIDEAETERRANKLRDAVGDLITVHVERATAYRHWNGDISTQLARLRGFDQFVVDMMERPEWLHGVLAFMRDGILKAQDECERAGDWTLSAHANQAMPYAEELDDPAPDGKPVKRSALWYFSASQETTMLGPARFEEFMWQYQRPIMERFGLSAYGCCEDLTLKIPVLRQLPNLRRVAVSPMADVARCAELLGTDYIISYRPSPSDMVGYDFDPARIRRILKRDLEACRGMHTDITLKDVETVQNDPRRVRDWVKITRAVIDEVWR